MRDDIELGDSRKCGNPPSLCKSPDTFNRYDKFQTDNNQARETIRLLKRLVVTAVQSRYNPPFTDP